MVFGKKAPALSQKAAAREKLCNQLFVKIQNEGMNISNISDKMFKISEDLKRKSNDSSFKALLGSLGFAAVSLVRLIGAILVGRRRGRGRNADQVLTESRRLAASVERVVSSATSFIKGNREMESMVRNLDFHNDFLKKRQARMSRLIDQSKNLGCLD